MPAWVPSGLCRSLLPLSPQLSTPLLRLADDDVRAVIVERLSTAIRRLVEIANPTAPRCESHPSSDVHPVERFAIGVLLRGQCMARLSLAEVEVLWVNVNIHCYTR